VTGPGIYKPLRLISRLFFDLSCRLQYSMLWTVAISPSCKLQQNLITNRLPKRVERELSLSNDSRLVDACFIDGTIAPGGLGGTCGEVDDGVERQRLRRAPELLSYGQAESSLLSLVVQCVSVRATGTIIRNVVEMQLLSQ
jgi:hypothetical protein